MSTLLNLKEEPLDEEEKAMRAEMNETRFQLQAAPALRSLSTILSSTQPQKQPRQHLLVLDPHVSSSPPWLSKAKDLFQQLMDGTSGPISIDDDDDGMDEEPALLQDFP